MLLIPNDHAESKDRVEQVLAAARKAHAAVGGLLDPSVEHEQNAHVTCLNAAVYASQLVLALAQLSATICWSDALGEALTHDEPDTDDVLAYMQDYLVTNTASLTQGGLKLGPAHKAFQEMAVVNAALLIQAIEAAVEGWALSKALCDEAGINYEKVRSGDKDALRALIIAGSKKTGRSISPEVAAKFGIHVEPTKDIPPSTFSIDKNGRVEYNVPGLGDQPDDVREDPFEGIRA